ncbi:MAG TPA: alpha/beta hydrolase [Thermoplasmata archaeon]|nr:alpha/beta hydrolase [Thermoplasmata archaeon]
MEERESAAWPVRELGKGVPVVFLHGYPLDHRIWEPQLKRLSGGHRIVLLDLPGYGLARDWMVPDTLAGFAESVHSTLTRGLSEPVVLVGHSFGGYVALELYRNHPELFEGLVLVDTRSEPDTPEAREKRLATVRRLENTGQGLDVGESVRALVAPTTWETKGPILESIRGIVRSVSTPTIVGSLRAIADRPDLTPVLSSIRVPTLVIWGENDRLIPPTQSRSMVSQIPYGRGVGIPGAGHLPSVEAPEAFASALEDFLEKQISS